MVSNITKIIVDEFKNMILDKGVGAIMIGGILLYSLLYTIPYHNHIVKEVPIGVINNDNDSSYSKEIIRELEANDYIRIKTYPYDLENAKQLYYADTIKAFVVIPKNFERDIKRGSGSFITMYSDSAYLTVYKQVATGISEVVNGKNTKLTIGSFMKKGMSKIQAETTKYPFEFINIALFNPSGSYQNYIYPIVLLMVLHQTLLIGIGLIGGSLRERLRGVKIKNREKEINYIQLDRISEFSSNIYEIVLGKSCAHVILYTCYALIYFLIYPAFVNYHMTYKIIPMLLIMIPFLFSVSFLGQSMVYFLKNRELAFFLYIPSSVPFVFLVGFVWPNETINPILRILANFVPVIPGANALIKINQMGADFLSVQNSFWILIAQCILYFILACFVTKGLKNETRTRKEI